MTFLALDSWREWMGYNPYHFWQLANDLVPVSSACNGIVREYRWQSADALGRRAVRGAIRQAGNALFTHLGYRVGRDYVSKVIQYPRPRDSRMAFYTPIDSSGRWRSVDACEGYIQEMGVPLYDALDTAATVTYSDNNNDGVIDQFSLTVDVTGLTVDAEKVQVFFIDADRLSSHSVGNLTTEEKQRYRILPIDASISGDTLTITGRSWLCVRPENYEGVTKSIFDPNNTAPLSGIFAEFLAVYEVTTNTNGQTTNDSQAVMIWETLPRGCGGWLHCCNGVTFNGGLSDPAAQGFAVSRAGIRNGRLGHVTVGKSVYDADNDTWSSGCQGCQQPDRVILRYLAGAPLEEINSNLCYGGDWDQVYARLAAAELQGRLCACDASNQVLFTWNVDKSQSDVGGGISFTTSPQDLNNPLGTRAGQIYAWKNIKNLMITRAITP